MRTFRKDKLTVKIKEQLIRFGLVGCGRISENHLDAIDHAPHAQLTAVCDILPARAEAAAKKYGCRWYTDFEEMLQREELDVCCILTPSGMHSEHACMAARHKVNVLCEKPLDVTAEKIDAMIACCRENGVKLGGIFQRRTFDAAIAVKEAIAAGYLGKVTMASAYLKYYRDQAYYDSGDWRGTWELDGGGALMNQGIHGVDLINWITGGIDTVDADCQTLAWDIAVEDTAVIRVKYKNGAMGVIEATTAAYPGLDTVFQICGTQGSVSFGDGGIYLWDLCRKDIPKPDTTGSMGGLNCQYNTTNYGHTYQIEDMALAALKGREPMIPGEDAGRSAKLILAIYESSRKKQPVKIK